ncbi:molybdopterin-dependent oxidoreductase [Polymorphobacter fuscus]|uniref:Molybdopterin-dependent oxidoreductase n=2 Tax=Sandarakinorhabdus fusca TaxID=1439888 RepID=A0A7C9GQQ2_9SPHN|nr:molybdopterin-dependent oxidoreductase [Polymorphobacter fuscus]MQT17893.1 molybdopterin-dependent oxidoreductase [Polymorphobacter fuscus]
MSRRRLIGVGGAAAGGLLLAGCDNLASDDKLARIVRSAEDASRGFQRFAGRDALAREFSRADMSPVFKVNGTREPVDADYQALKAGNFADWRLTVNGLVANPLSLSLAQLRAMPARTQITRHDCVEGWSAIGEWTGPQLASVLMAAGMQTRARYIVFRCADDYGGEVSKGGPQSTARYYESIDMIDAFHPQTILATMMNGAPLSIGHGAPLRLRVERQLGYKHAKYLMAIDVVDSLAGYGSGHGGYWEDRGYEWYAGI